MAYISDFDQSIVIAQVDWLNVRAGASTSEAILYTVPGGQEAGRATGQTINTADGDWYQIIPNHGTAGFAYVFDGDVQISTNNFGTMAKPSQSDLQNLLDSIILNDQILCKRLIVASELIERAKLLNSTIDLSEQENLLQTLRDGYNQRQDALNNSTLLKIQGTLQNSQNFISNWGTIAKKWLGLGVIPLVAIAIIAGSVAIVTVTAYLFFKPLKDASDIHLKLSDNLKKALDTLPPADKQAVLKDLDSQMKEAYAAGDQKGSSSNIFGINPMVALILAGGAVGLVYMLKRKKE